MIARPVDDLVVERYLIDLGRMLTWITLSMTVIGSLTTVALRSRSYLLAYYLFRKTGDLAVLREVARFDRRVRRGPGRG